MPGGGLARELEMCYASVAIVTNFAAGGISKEKLTHRDVVELMEKKGEEIKYLLMESIKHIPKERHCPCKDALKGATGGE